MGELQTLYEYNGEQLPLMTLLEVAHKDFGNSQLTRSMLWHRLNSTEMTVVEALKEPATTLPALPDDLPQANTRLGQEMTHRMLQIFFSTKTEKQFKQLINTLSKDDPHKFFKDILIPCVKEFGTSSDRKNNQNYPVMNVAVAVNNKE